MQRSAQIKENLPHEFLQSEHHPDQEIENFQHSPNSLVFFAVASHPSTTFSF